MVVAFRYEFGRTQGRLCLWSLTRYFGCWKRARAMFGRLAYPSQTCHSSGEPRHDFDLTPFMLNKANVYARRQASEASAPNQIRRRDASSDASAATADRQKSQAESLAQEAAKGIAGAGQKCISFMSMNLGRATQK